jgi:hypothetical protein
MQAYVLRYTLCATFIARLNMTGYALFCRRPGQAVEMMLPSSASDPAVLLPKMGRTSMPGVGVAGRSHSLRA